MKKLIVILLLFCSKTLTAQTFDVGAGFGTTLNQLRQQPHSLFAPYNASLGYISFQYGFKNKPLLVELNFESSMGFESYTLPTLNYATAGYLCYNLLPKQQNIMLQIKAGLFAAKIDPEFTIDYGPAISAYFGFLRIGKKNFIGFDLAWWYGLKDFAVINYIPDSFWPIYTSNTNLNYMNFTFRFTHKF